MQQKLTDLNFGVLAQVISDGSSTAPYRLSIVREKRRAKRPRRVRRRHRPAWARATSSKPRTPRSSSVGRAIPAEPLLITSSSNQLSGVIRGVTIDLHGTSDKPVTLGVTRSVDGVVDQFKQVHRRLQRPGRQDQRTDQVRSRHQGAGPAAGRRHRSHGRVEHYKSLNTVVSGAGRYRILADVGVTLGDGAKLQFDEDKFRAAYADDPDAVQNLFTAAGNAWAPTRRSRN